MIQAYDWLISIYRFVHMYIKIRPPNPKSSLSTNTVWFTGHATYSNSTTQLNWSIFNHQHSQSVESEGVQTNSIEEENQNASHLPWIRLYFTRQFFIKIDQTRKICHFYMQMAFFVIRLVINCLEFHATKCLQYFEAWGLKPVNFIRELQTHNFEYFFSNFRKI